MQTFLISRSFADTMRCLDYRRLGKQRVEAFQILKALRGETKGWVNHPATRMWRGDEDALQYYLHCAITEWCRRGYRNSMAIPICSNAPVMPTWIGDERIYASHRSNLLRKDPQWYGRFGWSEPNDIDYFWPR